MTRFLLDANLSSETARYLVSAFGFDVVDLSSLGLGHLDDAAVAALAVRERRVVVSFDLDWDRIYHQWSRGQLGIIILRIALRIADQTVESVNRTLDDFFRDDAASIPLEQSLVVIDDRRVRVVTGE